VRHDDLERYLALIHSSPPDALGRMLAGILEEPGAHLEHLRVFVLEVSLLLSRLLFAQDQEGASRLTVALEIALGTVDLNIESPSYAGMMLRATEAQLFAYYMGRLQGLLVLARRAAVLEIPHHVRAEVQDGGYNQMLLQTLAQQGEMTFRNLRQALRVPLADGDVPSSEPALHQRLTWLVKIGVVERNARSNRLIYTISALGRRLLQEKLPWVEAVSFSYRAYRKGISGLPGPFAGVLEEVFRAVDGELELSGGRLEEVPNK